LTSGQLVSNDNLATSLVSSPHLLQSIFYVLLALLLVWAAVEAVLGLRSAAAKRRARALPTDQKEKNRLLFMHEAFRLAGGSVGNPVRMKKLRRRLSWGKAVLYDTRDFLESKGLIKPDLSMQGQGEYWELLEGWTLGPRATLTAAGVEQVEKALKDPEKATTYFPPASVVFQGPVVNSPFQVNPRNSPQVVEYDDGLSLDAVAQFLSMYRDGMQRSPLPEATAMRAEAQLEVMGVELDQNRPDEEVLRQAGRTLRGIAEGAAGSAIWAGIGALAANIRF